MIRCTNGGLLVAKAKEQNYLHGAAIMTAGVIIMKILGALYKIPLGNMLGDDGYGLFLQAYYVYSLFLTLATAGFPVALSRMISAAQTCGRQLQARRTYQVAWWTFFVLGAVCSTVMFIFPDWLADTLIHSPDAALSIQALAPAVLLCCITSTYRGLTQGYGNMKPTTVSQILEVLAKVAAGLALAAYLLKAGYDKPVAVSGAIFGVTVGSLTALLYMLIYKMRNYRFDTLAEPDVPESAGTIFKNLLNIGIPIALGSVALALINLIDAGLCMTRLQNAVGYTYSHAKTLYGVYGKAQTLFNLPAAFITPLTISIVPAISAKLVMNARGEAGKISEDSLRISMAIALPMGVGLAVLSEPIMNVVYPNAHSSGPLLLCLLGIASVFVCFSLMSTAVLQATGKERLTLYSIIAGGLVKITINWFIVAIPTVNIYGAAIGTICCYVTMCVLNLIFINRSFENGLSVKNIFIRPAVPSVIMGVIALAVYYGGMMLAPAGSRIIMALVMCVAIGAAVIVYAVAVIKLRVITTEDMKLIPKGEKIAKLLHMS
jgi:stage V sporulation protein B